VSYIERQLGRSLDGCLVAQIVPNSPAVVAGLEATTQNSAGSLVLGDLVTAVNGEPVKQAEDLISAIEEKTEGETVFLTVLRKCDPNRKETVRVKLTTRDKLQKKSAGTVRGGGDGGSSNSGNDKQQQQRKFPSIWQ